MVTFLYLNFICFLLIESVSFSAGRWQASGVQKSNTDWECSTCPQMMWPPAIQSKHSSPVSCSLTEGCSLWEVV